MRQSSVMPPVFGLTPMLKLNQQEQLLKTKWEALNRHLNITKECFEIEGSKNRFTMFLLKNYWDE